MYLRDYTTSLTKYRKFSKIWIYYLFIIKYRSQLLLRHHSTVICHKNLPDPNSEAMKFSTKNFTSSSVLASRPILMQSRISLDVFQTESAINRAIFSLISNKCAVISSNCSCVYGSNSTMKYLSRIYNEVLFEICVRVSATHMTPFCENDWTLTQSTLIIFWYSRYARAAMNKPTITAAILITCLITYPASTPIITRA